jgi:hypothetical protein
MEKKKTEDTGDRSIEEVNTVLLQLGGRLYSRSMWVTRPLEMEWSLLVRDVLRP